MNSKTTFFLLLFLCLLFSCKEEMEVPVSGYFDVSIGYSNVNIIDLCTGKFSLVLHANSNNQQLSAYTWTIFGQSDYSTEQSVEVTFTGRETHTISLSVTNTENRTAGTNLLLNIELFLYPRTEIVEAQDVYGFPIHSSEISNTPYTNELVTFKTALEHDDLWWELTDAAGNMTILPGENMDGHNFVEMSFPDEGTIIAKSFFCEDKFEISEKEITFEIFNELQFSKATVSQITLEKIAENTLVEAYVEILVDGVLQLKTVKKSFQGPTNQDVPVQWNPATDLEIGDPDGTIEELNTRETEIEMRLFADDILLDTQILKADYLGHFSSTDNRQEITIGGGASPYEAVVIFDSVE